MYKLRITPDSVTPVFFCFGADDVCSCSEMYTQVHQKLACSERKSASCETCMQEQHLIEMLQRNFFKVI